MIQLHDIRYVRLGTRDLTGARRYAEKILGLSVGACHGREKTSRQLYFRSDDRDHTLVYFDGDPADHTVGFEVRSQADLEGAAQELERLQHHIHIGNAAECEQRRVRAFINFKDPSGNAIDLVVQPHHSGVPFFPSRDTGNTGFSHIGLRTTNATRDEAFWTGVLGAKVSDRIGDAPLLRIDEIHHKVALFPSAGSGVQHVNHQVASIDDIMRTWYLLQREGVRTVFGPGRHPTSGAMFLYFEGPDGMTYEFSSGVSRIADPHHQPRQFPFRPESLCMWGSQPDIPEFRS
ncbi:VOC family protein [Ramlibacter sp.]|uniref:VOC family protein n=1 Tax=Ramlibacter sp. TaxID=1917967 RepID=UPI003D0A655E